MSGSSLEVRDDLAAEQLDRLLHLGDRVCDEEQAGQGRDAGLRIDTDPLADLLGAPDQVALLEATGLLAERRLLERLEVLVELRAVEAPDRLEVHGFPAEGGFALGEEQAQRPHPLVDERATVDGPRVRKERLILLAVGAGADAEDHASA